MLELNLPPTLTSLLQDPTYKKFFLRIPRPAVNQSWHIWGLKYNDKWAGKTVRDYREAVDIIRPLLKDPDYRDVVIYSRNKLYPPPMTYRFHGWSWCGRCRRPTVFIANPRHPSLRKAKVISDVSAPRCFFCGIQESFGRIRERG